MAKIKVNLRCDVCDKYKRVERELSVGETVAFNRSSPNGRSVRISSVTGKVAAIDGDKITVMYRKEERHLHIDRLSPTDGANGLTVALLGECECSHD